MHITKFFSLLDVSFEICLMYFRNFINVCNDSNGELTENGKKNVTASDRRKNRDKQIETS